MHSFPGKVKRMRKLVPGLMLLMIATMGVATAKKIYPYRWVRVGAGLRNASDVEKVRKIAETAAQHGLNGILFSGGLDSLDLQPPQYFENLKAVREICQRLQLDIIPSFLSAGYGGAVLSHDKNLAAGLPVRDALFLVKGGEARLQPDPAVSVVNGGFEDDTAGPVNGFTCTGGPGEFVVRDRVIRAQGAASLRFENFRKAPDQTISIRQSLAVSPWRCYRLSCSVKAADLRPSDPFGDSNFQLRVLGGAERRPLQFENPKLAPNDDWHRVAVGFNTWGYDKVEIIASVSRGGDGRFWIDDLKLEEVGLINVLRRPGTPLAIKGDSNGTLYTEGKDFAEVADPALNFHYDHDGPAIRITPGSRISEGERLRVSFYHGTFIYNDQVPICMSEPKLYEIWEKQIRLVHQALAPRYYMLNMDELRAGGSCEACRRRKMTMGQILGDTLTRQFNLIRAVNPGAEVFVWSDMLDPNHNARPDRKWYYLAEGTYTDSWKYIPKELNIVCWYYEVRNASLKHFSSLGFKTMAGAYYDADNLDNPKGWLESLDETPGACGILYTTWLNKYDLLGSFGDLVSKRAE
jgi:hypothetical protein